MDKFQAAFEILLILSDIDGNIDPREIEVINYFIESNIGSIEFDTEKVIKNLSKLTGEGIIEELSHAATVFKNQSSAQDRITILEFSIELISADDKITDEEVALLYALGEVWNIDMEEFIQDL